MSVCFFFFAHLQTEPIEEYGYEHQLDRPPGMAAGTSGSCVTVGAAQRAARGAQGERSSQYLTQARGCWHERKTLCLEVHNHT